LASGLLRLKKKPSNVSMGSSHSTVYRKNKAIKELQAADANDSMDDLG
jgi:hypothetical protein